MWRDNPADHYSLRESWKSNPVDLSNVVLLKTRENLYVQAVQTSENKDDKFLVDYAQYDEVEDMDLGVALTALKEMLFSIRERDNDLPAAFAANALYTLEVNGERDLESYEKVLFPTLKAKAQYLHAEGIAVALKGLSLLDSPDEELVSTIVDQI